MSEPLRVAIAGLGTVGSGTVKLLQANAALLAGRCGRAIEIVAVADPDRRDRGFPVDGYRWYEDGVAMAKDAPADVVVELIGGSEGPARQVSEAALAAGRHLVTANKALLAHHGQALALAAERAGVRLAFEAAVAGGIPIVKVLREGLAANRCTRVHGILNGTCNFILSAMGEGGREFADVLAEAQALGYAEADPAADVDGFDTAHKLTILATVAFGCALDYAAVHVEGIRHISPVDLAFAEELGYRIKLLGIAALTDGGVERRVHPCMVPAGAAIAHVNGVFNAVVADLADIAAGRLGPAFGVPVAELADVQPVSMGSRRGACYIRLMVLDKPGVFADIAGILRDNSVSMEAVLQRARSPGEAVPVVMITHEAEESAVVRSLEQIMALNACVEEPRMIRIEPF